jgi:hypothetical protein
MSHKNQQGPSGGKMFADKRTMNPTGRGGHQPNTGANQGDQTHDAKNRLGSFEGKGEHARTGHRGHQ